MTTGLDSGSATPSVPSGVPGYSGMYGYGAENATVEIMVVLVCIFFAWWALQAVRFELFLKDPRGARARILQIILAVALGYGLAQFIQNYIGLAGLLRMQW